MKTKLVKPPGNTPLKPMDDGSSRLSEIAAVPLKLKNILVPLDYSEDSKKALSYAASFAQKFNARVILLHVLPINDTMGLGFDDDWRKEAEALLATLAQEFMGSQIPIKVEARCGVPSTQILNVAKEMDVDLIIMSTRSHMGRVHAFFSSVAGDVTRLAPCPVLVVRHQQREFVPSRPNPFKASQSFAMPPTL